MEAQCFSFFFLAPCGAFKENSMIVISISVPLNFKFAVSNNTLKNSITFIRGLELMKIP